MRTSRCALATVLLLGLVSIAATRLVAMRVEVEGLRPAGDDTVVALTVQIAPEDRNRVGRNAWLRAALQQGEETIDRIDRAIEVGANGQARVEATWPPGSYRLRVDVESAQGDATGFWDDAVTVPRLEPAKGPPARPTPLPLPLPTEPPRAPPAPAPRPTLAPPPEAHASESPKPAPAAQAPDTGMAELTVIATSRNQPALDLDRHAFRLRIDGDATPIESLAGSPGAPLSVVLAVDVSAVAEDSLPRVRQMLGRLALRMLEDGANLHLLTLDQTARSAAGWGASPDHIVDALATLGATEGGDLVGMVTTAMTLLDTRSGRKLLVLVSGGGDTATSKQWRAVTNAAESNGVPALVIGLIGEHLDRRTRRTLSRLSESSGGKSWFVRDTETLKLVVDHFADLVLSSYVVRFRPPISSDRTPLKVRVDPLAKEIEILHAPALMWKRRS